MLPLIWLPKALDGLEEIIAYVEVRNPEAAQKLRQRIEQVVELLPEHPYMFRPGRVAGTREAVAHPNYLVIYQVSEIIEVVAVLHARQRYP